MSTPSASAPRRTKLLAIRRPRQAESLPISVLVQSTVYLNSCSRDPVDFIRVLRLLVPMTRALQPVASPCGSRFYHVWRCIVRIQSSPVSDLSNSATAKSLWDSFPPGSCRYVFRFWFVTFLYFENAKREREYLTLCSPLFLHRK